MAEKQRITFEFDAETLEAIKAVMNLKHLDSIGETLGQSFRLEQLLLEQQDQGFTEVIVRNPRTRSERKLVPQNKKRQKAVS